MILDGRQSHDLARPHQPDEARAITPRWTRSASVNQTGRQEHFHDLRHTGNMLAASIGATLRDLMARMGHDSSAAALVYQHASSSADRATAQAVDAAVGARVSRQVGTPGGRVEESLDVDG